jgi:hypothetical protein
VVCGRRDLSSWGPAAVSVTEDSSPTVSGPAGAGGTTPGAGVVVPVRDAVLVNVSSADVGSPATSPPVYTDLMRAEYWIWVVPLASRATGENVTSKVPSAFWTTLVIVALVGAKAAWGSQSTGAPVT